MPRDQRDLDQLMTLTEVCDLLQVSRWTVLRLRKAGYLPTLLIGRCMRFPTSAVREFIRNEEIKAREEMLGSPRSLHAKGSVAGLGGNGDCLV